VLAALFEGFEDAATAGDDVFDDQDFFARGEFEVAAQFELIIDFFEKNEAQAELARHFLANDEAPHCWAHDCRGAVAFQIFNQKFSHSRDFVHVLADLSALKEVSTVQA
jgi:hypothetical protein